MGYRAGVLAVSMPAKTDELTSARLDPIAVIAFLLLTVGMVVVLGDALVSTDQDGGPAMATAAQGTLSVALRRRRADHS